mgnify:CR=1 FL=1
MSTEQKIKRGSKYAVLTVVAEYDKYEWQERYLCLLNESHDRDDIELTIKALSFAHPEFAKSGVIIDTPYGKRLKIDNAIVWYGYKLLRYGEAKDLLNMKILPFVTMSDKK